MEYILALPIDAVAQLQHAILYRRGVATMALGGTTEPHESLADRARAIFDSASEVETWPDAD